MKYLLTAFLIASTCSAFTQNFQEHNVFSGSFLEPYDFQIFDNHLFFEGIDESSTSFNRLYRTNGQIGDVAVIENNLGNRFDIYESLGEHLGSLYFLANTLDNPYELYKISSADGIPVQLSNFNDPNLFTPVPVRSMRAIENKILFDYNEEIGQERGKELWITDGTPEGTEFFLDINPNGDGFGYWVGELNGILFFSAYDETNGEELWRTDGTLAGTFMLKDINPSGDGFARGGYVFNNKIYFVGQTYSEGRELWATDGTEEGTQLIIDINSGNANGIDNNPQFTEFNGRLYFMANDGSSGEELWSTDGTVNGTELVADISEGPASSLILNITPFNNRLYFGYKQIGTNDARHLWSTDGSASGTSIIAPAAYIDNPRDMYQVGNELVFLINDNEGGRELWRTDGSDAGTYEIKPEGLEDQWEILGDGHFALFGGRLFIDAALNGDADLWSYGSEAISSINPTLVENASMSIYPNPSKTFIKVDIEEQNCAYAIYSIEGRLIDEGLFQSESNVIDVQHLASGNYILSIWNKEVYKSSEFMIE